MPSETPLLVVITDAGTEALRVDPSGNLTLDVGLTASGPITTSGNVTATGTIIAGSITSTGSIIASGSLNVGVSDSAIPYPKLTVTGPDATVNVETAEVLRVMRHGVGGVKNQNSAGFFVGAFEPGINGRSRLDINIAGTPGPSNTWGSVPDVTAMSLLGDGNVGVGTTAPKAILHISSSTSFGTPQVQVTQTTPGDFARLRFESFAPSGGAIPFWDIAAGGGNNSVLNFYAQGPGDIMSISATGVTINGSLEVKSAAKHFVQDHPTDPTKQIVYSSLEGSEVGTYTRGTWKLEEGKAVIDLPEHFGLVTSDDGLSVQLTPRGEWLQLYVVELTTRQLVVGEAQGKSGPFDYLIQGVRKGYEYHEVIRQKKEAS